MYCILVARDIKGLLKRRDRGITEAESVGHIKQSQGDTQRRIRGRPCRVRRKPKAESVGHPKQSQRDTQSRVRRHPKDSQGPKDSQEGPLGRVRRTPKAESERRPKKSEEASKAE